MAISLTHTTVAVGTDAGNGEIAKAQWNENHTLTMATARLLGRTTAGAGAVEEISVGAGLSLSGGSLTNAVAVGGSDTQIQFNDGGSFGGDADFTWDKTNNVLTLGTDLLIRRRAAATLQLGAADAASATAQTLAVQSVVAGTTNTAGANLTIQGSRGTGTGAGGSIIFQVAPAGSSGTAQNALVTALTITTSSGQTEVRFGNSDYIQILATGITINNSRDLTFTGTGAGRVIWSTDLFLLRDAANTLALRNGANAQAFRVYSTFTDASNYERGALNAGADFIELAAETAGTGDDNLDVRLTPAGTGNVRFGTHSAVGAETVTGYITIKDAGGTIRKLAVIS